MSYYIKSKDGKIYSDTIAGGTPFKEAIVVNEVRLDYPDKDVGGDNPYSTDGYNYWIGDNIYNSRFLVPYVAIKDASRPLIYRCATAYGATSIDEVDIGVNVFPEYYRPIAICSYKTRRNTYEITKDKSSDYPVMYFPVRHQTVVQKELYKGDKSMISHCDRTKGNTLYYYISENQKCLNSRWDSKWGPYATDAHNVDSKNAILRCTGSWIHDGDLTAAGNPFYSDVQIQNNYLQFFKQFFEYSDNDMFGFSALSGKPETSDKNRLTYFRLNIDEIKNKGNKLTLKYYWNYLYKNDSQMRTNYNVYGLDKPFVFNYWIGDDEEWPVSTDTIYGYKLNENLKSSLVNGVNTCEGVNTKYTFNMDDNTQKDPWNDVETYNNLWINWVNKGNDGKEKNMVLLKVANNNSALFTKSALCDMSVGNIGHTSYSAMLAGKRYVVNAGDFGSTDYLICIPKNDCPKGTLLELNLFNEIHNIAEYALSALKDTQCYENYTAHFTEQKFLKDQTNWGDYSANFLPYLRTDSNNCIFENTWYGCYFNQYTTDTTPKLVYKMWTSSLMPVFNNSCNLNKNDTTDIYRLEDDTNYLYSANKNYWCATPSWEPMYAGEYIKVYHYDETTQTIYYNFGKLSANISAQYSAPAAEVIQKLENGGIYKDMKLDEIIPKIYNYLTANNFFAIANMTKFDPTKSYTNGSVVYDKITKYTANCFIKAGYNLNSIAWNENLFNPINSTVLEPKLSANTSYNYAGSASYTIDLTNETNKKYLYVANPTTILLTPSANGMEACDSIITDFKLVYEATN